MGQAIAYALDLTVSMGLRAVAVILALAILDYGFQRWAFERDMRMTRWELKEELRRMEGDPKMKERRRRVQQQLAYQRMMREVPRADVVVTNPTHLAVALRYLKERMAAPRVVAKGEGFIAQRIREVALENGVPVVERKELARALYAAVEVGSEVPARPLQGGGRAPRLRLPARAAPGSGRLLPGRAGARRQRRRRPPGAGGKRSWRPQSEKRWTGTSERIQQNLDIPLILAIIAVLFAILVPLPPVLLD